MSDTVIFIVSLSIVFSAVMGVARFSKMDPAYHPFVYYSCLATVVEIADFILIEKKLYWALCVLTNIYALAEFFLLIWLFRNWGLFKRNKTFAFTIASFFLLWLTTLFVRGYSKMNYPFFIVASFSLIFFSISSFNRMVVNDRNNIFTNPKFWICIGFIIFYTYFILINTVNLTYPGTSHEPLFKIKLFAVRIYSNLLVNLLYAVAVLWIPRKKNILTLF